ncbi:MAG: TIM barrel protein [Steroidobacteraceae bacterium]
MRNISLAPLTVPALSPPEFISCASRAGYSQVTLRLVYGSPLSPEALLNHASLLDETRARLRDEPVSVTDIEVLVIDAGTRIGDCARLLEVSASFGARRLVVCVNDTDASRARDRLAELAGLAAASGLTLVLEFVPYLAMATLDQACALVIAAGAPNVGVLIDAIHFDRSGHRAADIARFPTRLFPYVQLCDARPGRPPTMDEIIRQAREERLYPGEGGIDLSGLLRALPPELPVSVEIPNLARIRQYGEVSHARMARERVNALLERSGWQESPE